MTDEQLEQKSVDLMNLFLSFCDDSEVEARFEFDNLRSDDPVFDSVWGCNDEEQQERNFYEWCSMYDDTKHIKKG